MEIQGFYMVFQLSFYCWCISMTRGISLLNADDPMIRSNKQRDIGSLKNDIYETEFRRANPTNNMERAQYIEPSEELVQKDQIDENLNSRKFKLAASTREFKTDKDDSNSVNNLEYGNRVLDFENSRNDRESLRGYNGHATSEGSLPDLRLIEDYIHHDEGKQRASEKEDSTEKEDGWEEVGLMVHSPERHTVSLMLGDKLMTLRMVAADGLVAPGAQLRRHPDGSPEPLLSRDSCHYSLYDGSHRLGSLHACHPAGYHAMLLINGSLLEVVPRESLPTDNSQEDQNEVESILDDELSYPDDSLTVDTRAPATGTHDENEEFQSYQPETNPEYVARNMIDMSKFNNVFSGHMGKWHFKQSDVQSPLKLNDIYEMVDDSNEAQTYDDNEVSGNSEETFAPVTKAKSQINVTEDGMPEITPDMSDLPIGDYKTKKSVDSAEKNPKSKFNTKMNTIINTKEKKRRTRQHNFPIIVEVALFLDSILLNNLYSLYSEDQLIDLILGLMNNVQAFFHQSSLGRKVDLTITQLYLLRAQPADLPTHDGQRLKLLKSFCKYQGERIRNSPRDEPNWDLAVYLSGLDLISISDNGKINDETMGLTYTGGVCNAEKSCVISEFSTTNAFGRPFPTTGALASLILAHEIGHSLGLRHDGSNNSCTSQEYMMAAVRGSRGGSTWSTCSKDSILQQSNSCLKNSGRSKVWDDVAVGQLAGQMFDAVAQCQLFLRDKDATLTWPANLMNLCQSVECSSPHRLSTYLAGQAFEGTYCGGNRWCRDRKCVPWTARDKVPQVPGGLSPWEEGPCTSACLEGGTGWKETRRPCNNPKPQNSDEGCITTTYQTDFCDDRQVCGKGPRRVLSDALDELCRRVSDRYPDALPEGIQLKHNQYEPWRACILYCRLKTNTTQVWTPKFLFKDDPSVPTHLPPGAPCHVGHDGTTYRCFHRYCIPHVDQYNVPTHRDLARYEYRAPSSLHDLIVESAPPSDIGTQYLEYPEFDRDDLY